jgi:hypothetical protein
MKERSPTIRSKRATGNCAGLEVARVDAFERGHARVGREPRVQLAVADVDADDALRAALQQRVGEAAGALAEVEAGHARDVEAEPRQRAVELQAAARDEAQLGVVGDLELGAARQVLARLGRHAPAGRRAPAHGAGGDQPLRGRSRRRHAALDEQLVGAHGGVVAPRPCDQ